MTGNKGGIRLSSLNSHRSCVASVPIFNHLEEWQMDKIMESAHPIHLEKGEILYRPYEQSETLYIVHKGRLRIYRDSESGREQTIRILGPGEFTGEYALFNASTHDSYAVATKKSSICSIAQKDLQTFLLDYPTISLKILEKFSQRLGETETQATSVAIETVDKRIAQYLINNVNKNKEVILPMTRKELASYLGTSPETISRKLTEFEEKGYIIQKSSKKIEILHVDQLA